MPILAIWLATRPRSAFAVIGEPGVAVHMLPADRDTQAWWQIQRARRPDGRRPGSATRHSNARKETMPA
jgi:hypothetical protein